MAKNKIYYLSTCSTCSRIISDLGINSKNFEMQDVKNEPITASQLEQMCKMSGTYESLFSRRSLKFRPMGLHEMELSEEDYRKYILEEYTFLKRPVMVIGDQIFVGNTKNVIEAAGVALSH